MLYDRHRCNQTIHLRLKTIPAITLTLNPHHPIHLPALTSLNRLLTHAIDIVTLTLSLFSSPASSPGAPPHSPATLTPTFMAAQLRVLAIAIADAQLQLRGPLGVWTNPLATPSPTAALHRAAAEGYFVPNAASASLTSTTSGSDSNGGPPEWTLASVAPSHFDPPLPSNISFHLSLQDAQLVLHLRALEPADAPVAFGTKIALAIGTARRLEHDEAERVFTYCCDHDTGGGDPAHPSPGSGPAAAAAGAPAPTTGTASASLRHSRSQGHLASLFLGAQGDSHGSSAPGHAHGVTSRLASLTGRLGAAPPEPAPGSATAPSRHLKQGHGHVGSELKSTGHSSSDGEGGYSVGRHGEKGSGNGNGNTRDVYVREKVRVETSDPNLLSLASKLAALAKTLLQARRNLATVMGEELED